MDFFALDFMPHGHCVRWDPLLLALHVGADALIASSYFAIPAILLSFARQRSDVLFDRMVRLFAAFLLLCGVTHVAAIVTTWIPAYGVEGLLKLATAGVSVAAAIALVPALPAALSLRLPDELASINLRLEREVAERRAAEKSAVSLQRAAQDASEAKSFFLANMSHELRTPMAMILGYADLLRDGTLAPDERDRLADVLRANGETLLRILDDLLDMSRIEAGTLVVRKTATRLDEIFAPVLGVMEPRAAAKGVRLRVAIGEEESRRQIYVDAARVRQIFTNVLGNAVKFTDAGTIDVRVRWESETLEIVVADTGPGIAPERLESVFRRFEQGASGKERGGAGLGLAIARELAGALGGDLTLSRELGRGSTFRVELPAPGVSTVVSSADAADVPGNEPRLDGRRILFADDGEAAREMIRRMLERYGADVATAGDGREALDRVAGASGPDDDFDAILLDLHMPRVDGYQAARELRRRGFRGPLVAISAFTADEDVRRCRDAGFDGLLPKSVESRCLASTLLNILART